MRIYLSKRIFMNEADGSPGNGAPAAPPTPAAPTAAPTAPEPPAPSIVDQVATLIDSKLKAFENGFFANARKAGVLGKDKPADPPAAPPPAPSALSAADVEAMLETERVLTRVQLEGKLTDAQVKRMKSALRADKPDDVSSWASTYLADMGLVRTEPATQVTAPTTPQPNGHPISDKGSPAPGGVANWERELQERPASMSAAAIEAMNAKHGVDVARRMRVDAALRVNGNLRVTPK